MVPDPKRPVKAVVAFALSFLVALYSTVQGRTDLDTMAFHDWLLVVFGAFITAVGVYVATNPKVPA